MACEMREETLIDLLAGELSEEETVLVEQHLAECRTCRADVNALALATHPFLSEESWQPDAAMADRILRWAQTGGWAAPPTPAPSVHTAVPGERVAPPLAQSSASSGAQVGARPASRARPSRPALFSWITRPLPSYATVGIALLALMAGLVLGGVTSRIGGRSVPTEAGGSDQPSRPTERSGDRSTGRLAARQAEGDSSRQATLPSRRARTSSEAYSATRPIAFVAVYTDAMRLTTPGVRDSF